MYADVQAASQERLPRSDILSQLPIYPDVNMMELPVLDEVSRVAIR